MDNVILKFVLKGKDPRIARIIMKKNKARKIILPNIKAYYRASVINTVWYLPKNY